MTITEWYSTFKISKNLPSLRDLQEVADSFFANYCDSYTKLNTMFEYLEQTHSDHPTHSKLGELLKLYKLPLQYQKSPKTLFRELSRDKIKPMSKPKKEENKKEELCWEALSPTETVVRFEGVLNKLCKSSQIMRQLRKS